MGAGSKLKLTLFGRLGCHLCEDMLRDVAMLRDAAEIDILYVDIDTDPGLAERYNDLVPVLMHGTRELARYRLGSEAVRAYLAEIR